MNFVLMVILAGLWGYGIMLVCAPNYPLGFVLAVPGGFLIGRFFGSLE